MARRVRVADLFCGAGGSSTGLLRACEDAGLKCELLAVNHWKVAVETHAANHPTATHLCETLDNINPKKAVPGGKLDLLIASPECFPAGTLVLTENGYQPIESIPAGTRVLTHNNRWRAVTACMEAHKDTVVVRGQGHPGLEVTAEHPLFTRRRTPTWPGSGTRRPCIWRWDEPTWTPANNTTSLFWATPSMAESLPVEPVGGRGFAFSLAFWHLVGLWVADGTVRLRERSSEVTICCGDHEADALEIQLSSFSGGLSPRAGSWQLRWRRRRVRTATLFETGHDGLARWLVSHFGRHATGKRLPGWIYGLDRPSREAFLAGYLQGDGHVERQLEIAKQTCQTVSWELAVGIRTLASTLGHRVSIHMRTPIRDTIEGRQVNIHPAFGVCWTVNPQRQESYDDGRHHWAKVKEILPGRRKVEVYNLSVEEDESYVAEGVVVHNCTHHSTARGGKPVNDQSRASAWCVIRWAEALEPRAVLIENVREFATWGPIGTNGRPLKRRKGETFQAWLGALQSLGYQTSYRVLNCADYGDATTRERLFVIARRGRKSLEWPEPTHAQAPQASLFGGCLPRWRAAREIIDWTLKGTSIANRKRPLKENTLKRIAAGLVKFGGEKFLVTMREGAERRVRSLDEPVPTITAGGTILGICEPFQPFILGQNTGNAPRSAEQPIPTITTTSRGIALIEPFLLQMSQSWSNGRRMRPTSDPVPTVTTADDLALCEPFIAATNHGDDPGRTYSIDNPMPTITSVDAWSLIEPFLVSYYGTGGPRSTTEPLPTATTKDRFGLVEPVGMDILFRMLTPAELAAAMSFPEGYRFVGNREQVVKQIGNAVPCRTAEALCRALLAG